MLAEWSGIYNKLGNVHRRTGGRCTIDSTFLKRNYPFLVKLVQNGGVGETPQEFAVNI
jgi:hypothetical protein